MGSARRHKVMNKYRDEMVNDMVFGDNYTKASQGMDYAATGVSTISEILKKKADSDKAKKDAEAKKKLEDEAIAARQAAEHARIDAMAEQDPNGPKHVHYAQLDAKARLLEQKAGMMGPGAMLVPSNKSAQRPWYFYAGIVGGAVVGTALLGTVMYKLSSGGRR